MKSRTKRLQIIKEIIINNYITNQEELLFYLEQKNYNITQATLSRDLKLLKVGKYSNRDGYYYSLPGADQNNYIYEYTQDFIRGYQSLQFSNNIGIIKTELHHANSVGRALDELRIPGIIGVVGGIDTVIFIMKDNECKHNIRALIDEIIA